MKKPARIPAIKMIKVISSNIKSIGYDAKSFQLFVKFKATGENEAVTFVYEDVNHVEFNSLLQAESVGKVFNSTIRAVKEGSLYEPEPEDEKSNHKKAEWINAGEVPVNGHTEWVAGEKAIAIDFNSSEPYAFEIEWDDDVWSNIGGEDFTHWMPLPEPPTS